MNAGNHNCLTLNIVANEFSPITQKTSKMSLTLQNLLSTESAKISANIKVALNGCTKFEIQTLNSQLDF